MIGTIILKIFIKVRCMRIVSKLNYYSFTLVW